VYCIALFWFFFLNIGYFLEIYWLFGRFYRPSTICFIAAKWSFLEINALILFFLLIFYDALVVVEPALDVGRQRLYHFGMWHRGPLLYGYLGQRPLCIAQFVLVYDFEHSSFAVKYIS